MKPGSISMRRVRWDGRFEYEFIMNYKLLQRACVIAGLSKEIDVERLIKGRYQDHLELSQYLHMHYIERVDARHDLYDFAKRRSLSGCLSFPSWVCCSDQKLTDPSSCVQTRSSTAQLPTAPTSPIHFPITDPEEGRALYLAERERDFYLEKLAKIEAMCKEEEASSSAFPARILELMYSAADIEAFVRL